MLGRAFARRATLTFLRNSQKCSCFIKASSTLPHQENSHRSDRNSRNFTRPEQFGKWLPAGAVALGIGYLVYLKTNTVLAAKQEEEDITAKFGEFREGLPVYTSEDVSQHHEPGKRIWVTFKSGVYDITEFVDRHPGGDKILMAAGGSVEPFWILYAVHKNPQVLEMLESFRIGNLAVEDRGRAVADMSDPYSDDPKRHPALIAASTKPFNAETPPSLLVDSYITPKDLFYVRNHLPAANIDEQNYELEVAIDGGKSIVLKLDELKKKFKHHTITATLQCAGNRRGEMIKVKEVKGLSWGSGAIGTATWTGVLLRDVLEHIGVNDKNEKIAHIQFEGYDTDPANAPYGASIPIEKALDPRGDVLLAFEMNGEPLTQDHGYPVRVIVPGTVAARSVKWLARIVATSEESPAHWQQNDYKSFSPNVDWLTVDFTSAPAIQDVPVVSAICEPKEGLVLDPTCRSLTVQGYAWSGGGRKVIRVDISTDGGKNWKEAELEHDSSPIGRSWAWRIWKIDLPIEEVNKETEIEICCKAVDSSYNNQPDNVAPIWNLRGVLNNSWHRVRINASPKKKKGLW